MLQTCPAIACRATADSRKREFLYINYQSEIIEKYKLTQEENSSIISEDEEERYLYLMDIIAKKRGAIISGGEIDYEKVSNIILNDFRTGRIGRITLEQVNGNK